jgi:hypothetical protein
VRDHIDAVFLRERANAHALADPASSRNIGLSDVEHARSEQLAEALHTVLILTRTQWNLDPGMECRVGVNVLRRERFFKPSDIVIRKKGTKFLSVVERVTVCAIDGHASSAGKRL